MMKKKAGLISVVVVVALAIGAYFLFFQKPANTTPPLLNHKPGDYIITNIYGSARLMKLTPVLVFENIPEDLHTAVTDYLTLQEPIIRDTIIFVIRAMTEAELREPGVENDVREKIMQQLHERLSFQQLEKVQGAGVTMDNLKTINYYDFVLQ